MITARFFRFYLPVLLIVALFACAGCADKKVVAPTLTPATATPGSTIDPDIPLIPREVLFGNPDRASVAISSDGKYISWLGPLDGVLNVWVAPVDNLAAAKPVTEDRGRGIRGYFWAHTNRHILYVQDKDGDENWRVYVVDLQTGDARDLTPLEDVKARIYAVSQKFPQEIMVGLNDRDPHLHDVYRVNIVTGDRNLVTLNTGFLSFSIDDDYNVRFAMRMTPDGGSELLKPKTDGSWESFMKIGLEDSLTTAPVGFDKTGTKLYLLDSRNRNTAALVRLDLETGEMTLIAENDKADLSGALVHPTKKKVEAVAFTYERKQWQILDDAVKPDLDYLRTVADGDAEVVGRTLDDKHWMVAYVMDRGPVRYYLYDRDAKKATFLFTNRKEMENLPMTTMHPATIQSRDGLNLVNYVSLPIGADSDGDGVPDQPLPTVLHVHGGPWSRVTWGYNPIHQWLTNRGYAVLDVNFRGSTGFGKAFLNAGNKQWGAKMHDDLIDSVQWAIKQGIAQPDSVAIFGGSYGGYATLVGVTMTPDVFACGVDIVGPSNLITLLESVPPYWQPMINVFTNRVGDHRTPEGRKLLRSRSPLTYVDNITKPLLIGQGANDPRVKQRESDQIVQAMTAKQIPVTYVLYPDEGHGFHRPENRMSFFAVAEAFLAQVLGGRTEPFGTDFEGSSITVPVGGQNIPGLMDALP